MVAALALDPKLGMTVAEGMTALRAGSGASAAAKARGQAQDFEAMFISSMFQHMFTGIDGDGPFGGGTGVGVWRSFLSDEYAKSYVKSGGIGLADQVYRSLLAHQETKTK
jgi:flagellar protein FlgJ